MSKTGCVMLFTRRDDELNAARGILNAFLLCLYLGLALALTVLAWAKLN